MKLLVALLTATAALVGSAPAQAEVRVHVGGTISVSGHVRVRGRRLHRIHRRRPVIYVQPAPTYYFAEPPPPAAPPCDCDCSSSCAAPVVAPAPYTVVSAPRQRHMWLGIGLRGSSLALDESEKGQGMGLVGRLRFRSVELELDIGKTRFEDLGREDVRIGGALYVPLTRGKWAPYLLVGAGVNQVSIDGAEIDRQGYLEGGGGLALHLSRRLSISGDVRWSSRKSIEDEDTYHRALVGQPVEERGVEGRLAAILYF